MPESNSIKSSYQPRYHSSSHHSIVPVIGFVGGSGCGKTTLVNALIGRLPGAATVLAQDLYYRDLSHLPLHERAKVNFDSPDALEDDLLSAHIERLSAGHSIQAPMYDFSQHIRCGWQTIEPGILLLVEGTLLLAMPAVRDRLDLSVFVDTPDDIRLQRRIERDQAERGRNREDIQRQYERMVRPMYEKYIAPSREEADCILDGTQPLHGSIEQLLQQISQRFIYS